MDNSTNLIKVFAHMYNDGSPCDGCKHAGNDCESEYSWCEERITETIKEIQKEMLQ